MRQVCLFALLKKGDDAMRAKTVHVCAYTRMRNGRFEYVINHWRSMPH